MNKFAVVRAHAFRYEFTKLHPTFMDAKEEAKRLCKKHRDAFFVIQIIGMYSIVKTPVVWRDM